jgi:ribosomal protein S18 acetylase RimI-like enzyme
MPVIIPLDPAIHQTHIRSIGSAIFNANDYALLEKSLQESSCGLTRTLSRVLVDNETRSRVLGFALVKQRDPAIQTYELSFLGISPDYQGRGGGSQLLRALETMLPPGASCWLLVNQDNTSAQNLYSKFGFHILCECLDPYLTPCYIMMRKEMSPASSPVQSPQRNASSTSLDIIIV